MKYFKNIELAKLYHVSEKTVRNWIESAKDGKIDLHLFEENDRSYIANTLKNTDLIEQMVQKGKKYKNTRGLKTIRPKKEFYETYNQQQIQDIIATLTIHKEIPLQYGYADGGADSWDHYAKRLFQDKTSNVLTETTKLLDITAPNIDKLLEDYEKINVVDLGPGNGMPVRSTLERLLQQGRLGRYIAIDISQRMLDILEENVKSWFGNKVAFEGYVRDLNYERFNDLLFEDNPDSSANLVFFLGCTLNNLRNPHQALQTINNSMGPNDLLFYNSYLDTPQTRRYFDLSGKDGKDHQQSGLIPFLWDINDSLGEIEQLFSEQQGCRLKLLRPKVDISIQIKVDGLTRHIELRKNEPILLWRHRHYSALTLMELFDKNDFDMQQITKSKDQNYALMTLKLKINNGLD